MNITEDAQRWMRRATAYELLSLTFLVPDDRLAGALSSGEYAEACEEVRDALGLADEIGVGERLAPYAELDEAAALQLARKEHTRLFLSLGSKGPKVTPYAGVWAAERRGSKGLLFVGEESLAIERFMRRCGVAKDLASGQANEPMDHVGTVCEFLEYLCLVNAQAVMPAETADVREDDYETFLDNHFRDYAQWLNERVEESSESALYLYAANLLAALVSAR